jgi:hypothetical protein
MNFTILKKDNWLFFLYFLIMKMKALWTFEMLGTTHQTPQHHIPEDLNVNALKMEVNLK